MNTPRPDIGRKRPAEGSAVLYHAEARDLPLVAVMIAAEDAAMPATK